MDRCSKKRLCALKKGVRWVERIETLTTTSLLFYNISKQFFPIIINLSHQDTPPSRLYELTQLIVKSSPVYFDMANNAQVELALAKARTAIDRLDFRGGIQICTQVSGLGSEIYCSTLYLAAFGLASDDSQSSVSFACRSLVLVDQRYLQRYC